MAQENAKGSSQQSMKGGKQDRELSVQDLLGMATGSNLTAIDSAAKGKIETSGGMANWPGAKYRQYARWFIQTKHPRNRQRIIIVGGPQVIAAYRTAATVMHTGPKKWPDVILNRSVRYYMDSQQAISFVNERQGAVDLYADTWGRPEEWTIVPVLMRTDKYDERGNKLKGFEEKFCFIEIEPGSALLNDVIRDAMSRTFFKNRPMSIVGAMFDVTRLDDKVASYGVWKMCMKEDPKTGSSIPDVIDPKQLFAYIIQQAKISLGEGNKKALYPATLDEAYPLATPDQQKMVLSTHFDIIEAHPDFRRRFKEPLKPWKQDMSGGAVQLDMGKPANDGTAISLDTLDNSAPTEDPLAPKSDGTEINLGDAQETEEAAPAAEEETETVEVTDNGDGTFVLADGTPCDEDGNPLEDPSPEKTEDEEEEPDEDEVAATEDHQQETATANQVEGDVTAFDLKEKPKTAAPKAPTPKVEPPKATTKAEPPKATTPKVEPPKAEPPKVTTEEKKAAPVKRVVKKK